MAERKKNQGRKVGNNRSSPARNRYWGEARLERRKVRNLVRFCGMTEQAAWLHWRATRRKRMRAAFVGGSVLVKPRGGK